MDRGFTITRKHYDIIVKQGIDNYPKEVGGFMGGGRSSDSGDSTIV